MRYKGMLIYGIDHLLPLPFAILLVLLFPDFNNEHLSFFCIYAFFFIVIHLPKAIYSGSTFGCTFIGYRLKNLQTGISARLKLFAILLYQGVSISYFGRLSHPDYLFLAMYVILTFPFGFTTGEDFHLSMITSVLRIKVVPR